MWVTPRKARTLRLLRLPPEWLALLTRDPAAAGLHVISGSGMRPELLLQRYGLPVPAAGGGGGGEHEEGDDGGGGGGGGGGGDDEAEAEEECAAAAAGGGRWRAVVGFRPTGELGPPGRAGLPMRLSGAAGSYWCCRVQCRLQHTDSSCTLMPAALSCM